jgi:hypothetical protein
MKKGVGSESGSISQRYGSGDPDSDPRQNVTDPQHWIFIKSARLCMIICARITGGKSIGFLEDMARLNVGLTRAKLALILIGNLDTLAVSI